MSTKRKLALCVVDDDPDELARFERYMKKEFYFGIGSCVDDAQRDLESKHKRKPDLFVLDMYFPTKVNNDADRAALDQRWEEFCAAEEKLKTQSLKGWPRSGEASEGTGQTLCIHYTQGKPQRRDRSRRTYRGAIGNQKARSTHKCGSAEIKKTDQKGTGSRDEGTG